MKYIFNLIIACFFLTSCSNAVYYYQLVDIASEDIQDNQSSNQDIEVYFDFWGDGGSTTYQIYNKADKTIYIKHDECQLIVNGEAQDLYDNSEYSNSKSSSITKGRSFSRSQSQSAAISGIGVLSGLAEAYGASISTSASASVSKKTTNTSSKTSTDKKVYILAPNSYRSMYSPNLQSTVFSDCDLEKYPTVKESNSKNGFSYTLDNTPLEFRIFVTYALDENFSNKKTFLVTGYVNKVSNWNPSAFIIKKKYKECDSKVAKTKEVWDWASPSRYYVSYKKSRGR